jgi:4-hydroxy-tetrahydrodipicolinate reductase
VTGTTGWFDRLDELKAECLAAGGAMFVASNFSIGMNIVFELNRRLAQLTKGMDSYTVSIEETHHIHKLDAPSGTAIHLAEGIIAEHGGEWMLADSGQDATIKQSNNQTIPITAIREGEVAGIHKVRYDSAVDTITLTHEAKSREGLAQGAVLAAEFLHGKKGFFTMRDLLRIES